MPVWPPRIPSMPSCPGVPPAWLPGVAGWAPGLSLWACTVLTAQTSTSTKNVLHQRTLYAIGSNGSPEGLFTLIDEAQSGFLQ
jgi:hypothetical protein